MEQHATPKAELWTLTSDQHSFSVDRSLIPFGALIETPHEKHETHITFQNPAQIYIPDPSLAFHTSTIDDHIYTKTISYPEHHEQQNQNLNHFSDAASSYRPSTLSHTHMTHIPSLNEEMTALRIHGEHGTTEFQRNNFPSQSSFERNVLAALHEHSQSTTHIEHYINTAWEPFYTTQSNATTHNTELHGLLNTLPDVHYYVPDEKTTQNTQTQHAYADPILDTHTHQHHSHSDLLPHHHDPLIG